MALARENDLQLVMIRGLEFPPSQLWALEIAREFGFKQFGH